MASSSKSTSTSTTNFRPSTTIGRKIKSFRNRYGYTQAYAADLLGLSRGQLSSLETGFVRPSRKLSTRITQDIQFFKISRAFHIST